MSLISPLFLRGRQTSDYNFHPRINPHFLTFEGDAFALYEDCFMRIKCRNEKPEKWGQIPDLPFPFKHLIPLLETMLSSPDSA